MKLIGFDFAKIQGEKSQEFNPNFEMSALLDISDIKEEKPEILNKLNILKILFRHQITYNQKENKEQKLGEILLEGFLAFSADEKESKEILDSWKTKEISPKLRLPLLNAIMRKCAPKALELEDSLGLPFHIPIPQLKLEANPKEEKKEQKDEK